MILLVSSMEGDEITYIILTKYIKKGLSFYEWPVSSVSLDVELYSFLFYLLPDRNGMFHLYDHAS